MAAVSQASWQTLDQGLQDKPLPQGADAVWQAGRRLFQRRFHI